MLIFYFLASYWSAGFETFLQAPTLASYWLEDFPVVCQQKVKYQYNANHSMSLAASQSAFIIG
jgi:hypothetical protein